MAWVTQRTCKGLINKRINKRGQPEITINEASQKLKDGWPFLGHFWKTKRRRSSFLRISGIGPKILEFNGRYLAQKFSVLVIYLRKRKMLQRQTDGKREMLKKNREGLLRDYIATQNIVGSCWCLAAIFGQLFCRTFQLQLQGQQPDENQLRAFDNSVANFLVRCLALPKWVEHYR